MNTLISSKLDTDRMNLLYRLSRTFNSSLNLDEVLNNVLDEIISATHAESGFVGLRQQDGRLVFPVARGIDRVSIGSPQSLITLDVFERVIKEGNSILTSNKTVDNKSINHQSIDDYGSFSIMCSPLTVHEETIGAVYVENCIISGAFVEEDLELLDAIASSAAIAVENARLYRDTLEKSRMEQELLVARKVQSDFIPQIICQPLKWEISARLKAAREVGGDFYDVISLDEDRLVGLVVGDVCDKGVGSALFMALFRSLIRAFAEQHMCADGRLANNNLGEGSNTDYLDESNSLQSNIDISTLVNTVYLTNQYIINHHRNSNMFSTLFFSVIDPLTGIMQYVNCGHEPPIVLNAQGVKARLNPTGPVVGLIPDMKFRVDQIRLSPGDTLLAYTDGVIDALNPNGEHFSEKRLLSLVTPPSDSTEVLLKKIIDGLDRYSSDQEQYDDITLLAARWRLANQDQTPVKFLINDQSV